MTTQSPPDRARQIRRQVRALAMLDAAERVGLAPVPLRELHTMAYFADALAPVWDLSLVDAILLKQRGGPVSPTFQRDLDALVGMGMVIPSDVSHVRDETRMWRLSASYSLNHALADPALDEARGHDLTAREVDYVTELVFALSGLGLEGIQEATASDAGYSDEMVAFGGVLEMGGDDTEDVNVTARMALRFRELVEDTQLDDSELLHLYIRHLYQRLVSS